MSMTPSPDYNQMLTQMQADSGQGYGGYGGGSNPLPNYAQGNSGGGMMNQGLGYSANNTGTGGSPTPSPDPTSTPTPTPSTTAPAKGGLIQSLGTIGGIGITGLAARKFLASRGAASGVARAVGGRIPAGLNPSELASGEFTPYGSPVGNLTSKLGLWNPAGAGQVVADTGEVLAPGAEAGLTTAGMVAAPIAGLVAGGLAWKGINSQNIGGEGSGWDRGLTGAGGGALAGGGIGLAVGGPVGAAIGAAAGGIIGGAVNLLFGDSEKDLRDRLNNTSKAIDSRMNQYQTKFDIAPQIMQQARGEIIQHLMDIRGMDIGTDEKVKLFQGISDSYAKQLVAFQGSRTDLAQAQADQARQTSLQTQLRQYAIQQQGAQQLAMQKQIVDSMAPYIKNLSPQMAAAYTAQANAIPAALAYQGLSSQMSQQQAAQNKAFSDQIAMANLAVNQQNAATNTYRAHNPSGGGGTTPSLNATLGAH